MKSGLFACKIGAPLAAISELDFSAERGIGSPKPLDAFSRASRRTPLSYVNVPKVMRLDRVRQPVRVAFQPERATTHLDTQQLSVIDRRRDPNGEAS